MHIVCICMHSHACSCRKIQPSFDSFVVKSDGQPIFVASSLTDCAEMERFLLHTSACFFFSRTRIQPTDDTVEEEGDGEESEDEDLDDM